MGNQSSSEGGGRTFGRSGNSLGLSRSELEKRCRPSGLYNNCKWDDKAIRKLVGDGKLASRMKGCEDRMGDANQECPICFLYYKEINRTKCCGANICTECYLQVRPQKDKQSCCPFCNSPKVAVTVAKKLTQDQVNEQKKDEERVKEARKRSQSLGNATESGGSSENFGSSLQQIMRARSESFASNTSGGENANSNPNSKDSIISLAMTPEERRRLEAEMRAQLSHPLTMRVEAEAAERRMENDRAYSRTHRGSRGIHRFRRRRGRGGGGRDWNEIVDAFERGGNGHIQSIDDLVVLEAAILLSMGEEARTGGEDFDPARHARDGFPLVRNYFQNRQDETGESSSSSFSSHSRQQQIQRDSNGNAALDAAAMFMRGISEEEQMAMAIAASLQDQGSSNTSNSNNDNDNDSESDNNSEDGDNPEQPDNEELEEEILGLDGEEEESVSNAVDTISDVAEESDDFDCTDDAFTDDDDDGRAYGGDAEVSSVEDNTGEPPSAPELVDENIIDILNNAVEGNVNEVADHVAASSATADSSDEI